MPHKKPVQPQPMMEALAPDSRPALEALAPERAPRRVSTPARAARSRTAVRRLLDGAGCGGAWDARDERR